MAMSVEEEFVPEFLTTPFTFRRNVVDFNDIGVLKEHLTPTTFPLLFAQQCAFDPIKHGVVFEPLAPVQEIASVGTGCSLHFDVLLDMRLAMFPQQGVLAAELPALSFLHMPVFVRNPVSSFMRVRACCPPSQLEVEHIVTGLERLCGHRSTVVIGPSPIHPVQLVYELFLRSMPVSCVQPPLS